MKIEIPHTLAEVQSFVTKKIPESLHLDYKRSEALKKRAPGSDRVDLSRRESKRYEQEQKENPGLSH